MWIYCAVNLLVPFQRRVLKNSGIWLVHNLRLNIISFFFLFKWQKVEEHLWLIRAFRNIAMFQHSHVINHIAAGGRFFCFHLEAFIFWQKFIKSSVLENLFFSFALILLSMLTIMIGRYLITFYETLSSPLAPHAYISVSELFCALLDIIIPSGQTCTYQCFWVVLSYAGVDKDFIENVRKKIYIFRTI